MRKKVTGIAAAMLLAAGCAQEMPRSGATGAPDKFAPVVDVVGGRITVDQETIRFGVGERNVRITWQLARDDYRFPADGIEIAGGKADFTHCGPQANGRRFSCVNVHSRRETYKYTINVEDLQGRRLTPLDPFIQND